MEVRYIYGMQRHVGGYIGLQLLGNFHRQAAQFITMAWAATTINKAETSQQPQLIFTEDCRALLHCGRHKAMRTRQGYRG